MPGTPGLAGGRRAIAVPTGFPWTPGFAIRQWSGRYYADLDTTTLKRTTSSVLYVSPFGSDANAGTNPILPLAKISTAINKWTNATIYVLGAPIGAPPTVYPVETSWVSGVPFGAEQNIIAVSSFATLAPGRAISSVGMLAGGGTLGAAWSNVGGSTPSTYSNTLAATPYAVIDAAVLDTNGLPTALTVRASVALVEANPGSWYWAAGVLYVRRLGSAAPDGNLRPLKGSTINGWLNTALNIYVEGLTFEGGNARCFYWQSVGTACAMVDCDATHGQGEGLAVSSSTAAVTMSLTFVRCRSDAMQAGDGFPYTITGAGTTLNVAELACTGNDNGRNAGSNQGSTGHVAAGTTVNIVRVGCTYAGNEAQEVADVGDGAGNGGCSVWNVGCLFDGLVSTSYGYTGGDATAAWMHGCRLERNATDLQAADAGVVIKVFETAYRTTAGAGTITRYIG